MKNIAFFPLISETLPFANYINEYNKGLAITRYLSYPGSGLIDMDAGFANSLNSIGSVVESYLIDDFDGFDTVFIADHKQVTEKIVLKLIVRSMEHGCKIICALKLSNEALLQLCTNDEKFIYLPIQKEYFKAGMMNEIRSRIIFVGGIIEAAGTMDVFYRITGELRNSGHKVLSFSNDRNGAALDSISFIHIDHSCAAINELAVYINTLIKKNEMKQNPDYIVVKIPDGVFEFSDFAPNGSGILPYIYSAALIPDIFICCVPYDMGEEAFVNGINHEISRRYGYGVDYVHLSNAVIDGDEIITKYKLTVSYVPYNQVAEKMCRNNLSQRCVNLHDRSALSAVLSNI